jgi:hypothetical protein
MTVDDYRVLVNSCSCEAAGPEGSANGDIDHEFLCGIMDRTSTRTKLPVFLQGLEQLDFRVRAGLLKT